MRDREFGPAGRLVTSPGSHKFVIHASWLGRNFLRHVTRGCAEAYLGGRPPCTAATKASLPDYCERLSRETNEPMANSSGKRPALCVASPDAEPERAEWTRRISCRKHCLRFT